MVAEGTRRRPRRNAGGIVQAGWKQLLAEAEPPPIDPAIRESLDDFVARRKREIEAGG